MTNCTANNKHINLYRIMFGAFQKIMHCDYPGDCLLLVTPGTDPTQKLLDNDVNNGGYPLAPMQLFKEC